MLFVSMQTLCTIASEAIKDKTKLPPYDKNGSGTPVKGINPNIPPKLTKIWMNI